MNAHARIQQLAAASIDFALTANEQAQLDDHLSTCPSCRATAAAYRREAALLQELAFAPPPPSVRSAVLAAAGRPAVRTIQSWKLLAVAALLAAALLGALLAVGAWNLRPTLVERVPIPSPGLQATPMPTLDASLPSIAPTSILPAAELGVVCDGSVASILLPTVQARPDGVHLRISNTSPGSVRFDIEDETGLAGLGDSVDGPTGTYVYDLPPGQYGLDCDGSLVAFDVVDPAGHYTSPALSCELPGSGTTGTTDFAPGARGPVGPILEVAREQIRGLKDADTVEIAGYPEAGSDRTVRVVRDGAVIAAVEFAADGRGGWLTGSPRICPGLGISVPGAT